MMNHAISDYFHFDDQFFRTLKPLLFSPGKLTVEYMAGRRASYLHPVKMYIFISLIYFLLLFRGNAESEKKVEHQRVTKQEIIAIKANPNLSAAQKKAILEKLPYTITPGKNGKPDDTVYRNLQGFIMLAGHDTSYAQYQAAQNKLAANKRDGFLGRYLHKKAIEWKMSGENVTSIIIENFDHNAPKLMFILLPLFALVLKITFSKNKKLYVEHLIYSFHLHCFLFLFLSAIMLVQMILPDTWFTVNEWLSLIAFLIIAWYVYSSLRTVYHRSRFRTITKMIGLSFSYFTLLVIFGTGLLVVTAIFSV